MPKSLDDNGNRRTFTTDMQVRITIRTIRDDKGEPLFCGKDVAVALGYKNPENVIAVHVEDEDKTSTLIQGSGSNYKSKTTFINESGLYALILSSKLESARRFKHWVTSEVLPAIRKQGGYMVARTDESDDVIMARALQIMQAIHRNVIGNQ